MVFLALFVLRSLASHIARMKHRALHGVAVRADPVVEIKIRRKRFAQKIYCWSFSACCSARCWCRRWRGGWA